MRMFCTELGLVPHEQKVWPASRRLKESEPVDNNPSYTAKIIPHLGRFYFLDKLYFNRIRIYE